MPVSQPPASSSGSVATDTIWDAAGDLAVGTGADTAAKLAIGSNTFVLTSNGTTATWAALGVGALTYFENYLAADVTMTTAGTFYDGGAVTLSAGTWDIKGAISVLASTTANHDWEAKLWDGTTVKTRGYCRTTGTAQAGKNSIYLSGIVVIAAGTPTWKISVTSNVNADTVLGTATPATYISAMKIA